MKQLLITIAAVLVVLVGHLKIFAKLPDKETSKLSNSTWLMGWM